MLLDGRDLLISTEVLVAENRFDGATWDEARQDASAATGMSEHVVLPDYENWGIQHADCLLKVLDEERLLVLRPPADHPLRERYDAIVTEHLEPLLTRWGRPFEILRMDTGISPHGGLAPYVNSVVLNKVVYVPRYGIPEDETALEQWRAAMPGYEVRGYTFSFDKEPHAVRNPRNTGPTGWRDGDVLHCRTPMRETALDGEYTAHLPQGPASGEIEYAVEATSEDGRVQRWPRPSKAWLRAAID